MVSVTQLGYVGISASNVEEWEHFATEILGLQSNGIDSEGNLTLRMDEYSHRFIVSPSGKDDLEFVGFQVTDEPALHEIAEQLRQAGVEVTLGTGDEAKGRRVESFIKFEDPDGTPVMAYCDGASLLTREPPSCATRRARAIVLWWELFFI